MSIFRQIDLEIKAILPDCCCSFPKIDDQSTWTITAETPGYTVTQADKDAAQVVFDNFAYNDWEAKRTEDRGTWQVQLEYLIDNGFDAFKARDDAIKVAHPKP